MIDSTVFGSIMIDGKTYNNDVIVSWDGEVREIELTTRHVFGRPEFERIMEKKTESIIVGTGQSGLLHVSEEVRTLCRERNIELIQMVSKRAIEKFNDLLRQGRKVVAFIHVTC